MKLYQALSGAAFLSLPCVFASENPSHIRVQTLLVEMPHTTYTTLLTQPLAPPVHQSTQALIREKKARIINSEIVIASSGQKATIESIHEFISPTEVQGSGISGSFTQQDTRLQNHVAAGFRYHSPAFETRNVGSTLEIEPTIAGNYIDLRFVPEWISMPRITTFMTFKDRWGNADIKMPEFFTIRATTAVTLANNQYLHVSTHTPLDAQGKSDPSRKLLLFVKATIIHPALP